MYKRILLKLSGEALQGSDKHGINTDYLLKYAEEIKLVADNKTQVAIVIGGGNIFRGLSGVQRGFDRVKGDQMGMLATVINSIAIQSVLLSIGQKAKVLTSIRMEPVGEYYSHDKAIEYMNSGYVVIIAGGTSNPFFTTDSAAALRAIETKCNVLLKGTRVDGIYTADPEIDKSATKFDSLTFDEAYSKNLKIMDLTAFTLCKENDLPVIVFDINKKGSLLKIVNGETIGTIVKNN
ncbi:MAG: UMP kinase [Prevotellaceae bacterium]|jgi:uridylate kinase|nr:UMP kinase [Prevotellaceae bacterium]